jgi:predicted DNA-binding transcriptional regulator AlpA
MERKCIDCGAVLARDNTGELCSPCQKKRLYQRTTYDDESIDAQEVASILGLTSAESVKRLARDDKLPPRVPEVRKWQWYKKDIDAWIEQKQKEESQAREKARKQRGNRVFRRTALGIASNLRKCRNDPIIYLNLSDKTGDKVYGQEYVFATVDAGQVEPIKLVKVDKSVALRVLKELPRKAFPELIGITDWADLTYDKINEDLIVRVEAYF